MEMFLFCHFCQVLVVCRKVNCEHFTWVREWDKQHNRVDVKLSLQVAQNVRTQYLDQNLSSLRQHFYKSDSADTTRHHRSNPPPPKKKFEDYQISFDER